MKKLWVGLAIVYIAAGVAILRIVYTGSKEPGRVKYPREVQKTPINEPGSKSNGFPSTHKA